MSWGCGSGRMSRSSGHDDLPTSELLDPPLATIVLDRREMGRTLMRRLLGQDPPGDYVAPVELVERASLQAPGIRVHRGFTSRRCTLPAPVRQLGNEALTPRGGWVSIPNAKRLRRLSGCCLPGRGPPTS